MGFDVSAAMDSPKNPKSINPMTKIWIVLPCTVLAGSIVNMPPSTSLKGTTVELHGTVWSMREGLYG
jgi:hypothetical protein